MAAISRQLAAWAAALDLKNLPPTVIDRVKGVTLHGLASALVGHRRPNGTQALALMMDAEEGGGGVEDADAVTTVLVQLKTEPPVRLRPSTLHFGECTPGETKTAQARLLLSSDALSTDDLNIQIPRSLRDWLTVCLIPRASRDWDVKALLTTPAGQRPSLDEPLLLIGTLLGESKIEIPLQAFRTGTLTIPGLRFQEKIAASPKAWATGASWPSRSFGKP